VGLGAGLTRGLGRCHNGKFSVCTGAKQSHGSARAPGLAAGFATCGLIFWDCEHRGKKSANRSEIQVALQSHVPWEGKGSGQFVSRSGQAHFHAT